MAGPRWFCVMAEPSRERLAQRSLQAEDIQAFLPLARDMTPSRGEFLRPLFPGYLFALLDLAKPGWGVALRSPGVAQVLGDGTKPLPLAPGFVEGMLRAASKEGWVRDLTPELLALSEGDDVLIAAGPFAGHRGEVLWSSEHRVRLLFRLFGASRDLTLARSEVRKVAKGEGTPHPPPAPMGPSRRTP